MSENRFTAYDCRHYGQTVQKRIGNRTKSLYDEICKKGNELGAMSYYLPRESNAATVQITRGIPYAVTFTTASGLRSFMYKNAETFDGVIFMKEINLPKDDDAICASVAVGESRFVAFNTGDPAQTRLGRMTRCLYDSIMYQGKQMGAISYYLPRESTMATVQITPEIPYLVSFVTPKGLRVLVYKNASTWDGVILVKEEQLPKEGAVPELITVAEETVTQPSVSETASTMEEKAKEWWAKYWPTLEAEIDFVGGKEAVSLDNKVYRIPDKGIFPYIKQYIETASKGSYTLDSIDDDLNGLAVPVFHEAAV